MEARYYAVGEKREVKGSLNRVAPWVFVFVMLIAGAAELMMYKNVFMSQEIGFVADLSEETKFKYDIMAMFMALGFTVMIIWMAHKMGEILRHLDSASANERKGYIAKLIVIALVTASAVWATVDIRRDMHKILALDKKIDLLQEARVDSGGSDMYTDAPSGFSSTDTNDEDEGGGFGSDEESEDDESSDGFGDDGDTEETSTLTNSPSTPVVDEEQRLRDQGLEAKGQTAWLFSIINIFIVIGGVFLSYETHTSSKIYETLEKNIKGLEKQKKAFEKELATLDKKIEHLKSKKIDKLFNELLYRAALYDKEVRTYNTYLQIFEFKMQFVEDYLKNIYENKGVAFKELTYRDALDDKINLDSRKELHHVNNIHEYMIYRTQGSEDV